LELDDYFRLPQLLLSPLKLPTKTFDFRLQRILRGFASTLVIGKG